jgi:hypothetical protein
MPGPWCVLVVPHFFATQCVHVFMFPQSDAGRPCIPNALNPPYLGQMRKRPLDTKPAPPMKRENFLDEKSSSSSDSDSGDSDSDSDEKSATSSDSDKKSARSSDSDKKSARSSDSDSSDSGEKSDTSSIGSDSSSSDGSSDSSSSDGSSDSSSSDGSSDSDDEKSNSDARNESLAAAAAVVVAPQPAAAPRGPRRVLLAAHRAQLSSLSVYLDPANVRAVVERAFAAAGQEPDEGAVQRHLATAQTLVAGLPLGRSVEEQTEFCCALRMSAWRLEQQLFAPASTSAEPVITSTQRRARDSARRRRQTQSGRG